MMDCEFWGQQHGTKPSKINVVVGGIHYWFLEHQGKWWDVCGLYFQIYIAISIVTAIYIYKYIHFNPNFKCQHFMGQTHTCASHCNGCWNKFSWFWWFFTVSLDWYLKKSALEFLTSDFFHFLQHEYIDHSDAMIKNALDVLWCLYIFTHWGRDKMAAIFQMTFSNAFSWIKMFEFW